MTRRLLVLGAIVASIVIPTKYFVWLSYHSPLTISTLWPFPIVLLCVASLGLLFRSLFIAISKTEEFVGWAATLLVWTAWHVYLIYWGGYSARRFVFIDAWTRWIGVFM
jgi:hypothetical protein